MQKWQQEKTEVVAIVLFTEVIVKQFEGPSVVLIEKGPVFLSAVWKSVLKIYEADAKALVTYLPHPNGLSENELAYTGNQRACTFELQAMI